MKVFIWWSGKSIASVTLRQSLVLNKIKRDGFKADDRIEVWENEKRLGIYHNNDDLMDSLRVVIDEDED